MLPKGAVQMRAALAAIVATSGLAAAANAQNANFAVVQTYVSGQLVYARNTTPSTSV